jgi:hypothetical protein
MEQNRVKTSNIYEYYSILLKLFVQKWISSNSSVA